MENPSQRSQLIDDGTDDKGENEPSNECMEPHALFVGATGTEPGIFCVQSRRLASLATAPKGTASSFVTEKNEVPIMKWFMPISISTMPFYEIILRTE